MPYAVEGSMNCVAECPPNMHSNEHEHFLYCEFQNWCNVQYPEGYDHTYGEDNTDYDDDNNGWAPPDCCGSCMADVDGCIDDDTQWCCSVPECADPAMECMEPTETDDDSSDGTTTGGERRL